jgi:hypothetical protein
MGAFNEGVKVTFLEEVKNRKVVAVSLNLLHGAAVMMRLNSLRSMGLDFIDKLNPVPQEESKIRSYLS